MLPRTSTLLLRGLCLLVLAPTIAAGQDEVWNRLVGSTFSDTAAALAPDGAGGVYATGSTSGSLGGVNAGGDDVWLSRYDAAGTRAWIRQFGDAGFEWATALAADGEGGVYVAGSTRSSLGGPNAGDWDAWIARYDGAGNQMWIRQFGTTGYEYVYSGLIADGAGGVYLTGITGGSLAGPNAGYSDIWLARYDGDGTQTWVRQFGSALNEHSNALAADGEGGVIVAGWSASAIGGPYLGGWDAWMARYDATGERVWIRQLGTASSDQAHALLADGAGGVFVGGWTEGAFGGPNKGDADAWLARYDSEGDRLWIEQLGTGEEDHALALATDGAGGVFVAGTTLGSLAGPNLGDRDIWLARYSAAGARRSIRQVGTSIVDHVWDLTADGDRGVFLGGRRHSIAGGPTGPGAYWLARYGMPACAADWDGDTLVNSGDVSAFLTSWLSSIQKGDLLADFNSDLVVNSADISAFLTAWLDAVNNGC